MFLRLLLAALAEARVPYCIVGGVAVNLHGVPRMTYDVDLVVRATDDAYARADGAFRLLGLVPRADLSLLGLAAPETRRALREHRNLLAVSYADPADPLRHVDVLVDPDVDDAGLVARAERRMLGRETLHLVARSDLLTLKRRAGRPTDLADVAALELGAEEA